jgi:hypothetical protein
VRRFSFTRSIPGLYQLALNDYLVRTEMVERNLASAQLPGKQKNFVKTTNSTLIDS